MTSRLAYYRMVRWRFNRRNAWRKACRLHRIERRERAA